MPQIAEPDLRKSGFLENLAQVPVRQVVPLQRFAQLVGEHKALLVPAPAHLLPPLLLRLQVFEQRAQHARQQLDHAAAEAAWAAAGDLRTGSGAPTEGSGLELGPDRGEQSGRAPGAPEPGQARHVAARPRGCCMMRINKPLKKSGAVQPRPFPSADFLTTH
jgi:hypothetical protein